MKNKIECVHEGICHLGEGPLWNGNERKLYWTDILNRRIWIFDELAGKSSIFWEGGLMVGGFAFTQKGEMVLCAEKGVYLLSKGSFLQLFKIDMADNEFFNDITTDPRGRIFAGTLTRGSGTGCLYLLEKGASPRKVLEGVSCSNGMTFSLDLRTFYHTDTGKRRVNAYDYDISTGTISNPRLFFQGNEEQGFPDGMTIDMSGYIWQAFWGSSAVRRISPHGEIVEEIMVPAIQPSSVIFGGEKLEDLYITTACQGATNLETGMDEKKGVFLGGKVYRLKTCVKGRPEWPADLS